MSRKVNYFEAKNALPSNTACALADFGVNVVPVALGAVETRKAKSFWRDTESWKQGYQALCRFQEAILMSCADDLRQEIRAGRGLLDPQGPIPPIDADPWAIPLGSVAQVVGSLNTNGRSAALILASIEEKLGQQGLLNGVVAADVARIRQLLEPENDLPPDPPTEGEG